MTKDEFKSMKRQHSKFLSAANLQDNLNSKLKDLEEEKNELKNEVAKNSKGTKLVVCLQNFVRKML